jgi:lipoate-protein ligase A
MDFLDLTLPTLEENLALDEALLLETETGRGGEVLRLWEWPALAVVLGAAGRIAEEVDEPVCAADGVPVRRRASGGGTVLLGPGCLLYSLVLRGERSALLADVQGSYRYILGRLCDAWDGCVAGIEPAGTSDLAVGGRKVSGNAQQRKRGAILHHGTLLYDFDITKIARYLPLPARRPVYRDDRPHAAFLGNVPVGAAELKRRLREAWDAATPPAEWSQAEVRRLVVEKYSQPEWVRRR